MQWTTIHFSPKAYKLLSSENAAPIPPAYRTRIIDRVPRLKTPEEFCDAFKFIAKAKMDSSSKSLVIDLLNRTIATPKLLFLMNKRESDRCVRCNVIADTTHITSECQFAFMMLKTLNQFFLRQFPKIKDIDSSYMFCSPLKGANKNMNEQFIHLFAALHKCSFSLYEEDRFPRWSSTPFYAKALSVINNVIAIRRGCRWTFREISKFHDFFLTFLGRENVALTPMNQSHFRLPPNYL